ncbi:MAG: carbohydrate deacetylase [Armatimonadota bacterium]
MPAEALIVNADDLGLWPSVDRGIFAAWSAGAVGDSTAFANAPALEEILARARAAGLPVGIHLNLTFGCPLSDPAEIPALVTPAGEFMKRRAWTLPLPAEQVRLELSRQVERVLATGWQPSHLDLHHHVHTYPDVLAAVIELARELRLPVRSVNPEMRAALREAGIPTPDHFSMAFYGENATVGTLITLVEECPGGILEIMTHPGYADPALPSSYREERERELAALTDPVWREYLSANNLRIAGFSIIFG